MAWMTVALSRDPLSSTSICLSGRLVHENRRDSDERTDSLELVDKVKDFILLELRVLLGEADGLHVGR
jgi:hypothetical protein